MTKFTDNLWSDLVQERGSELANASQPRPARHRRPGVIAGSTLALAVAGTALGLGLTGPHGTAAQTTVGGTKVVTEAYTITQKTNGSVLLHLNYGQSLPGVNQKLASMGIHAGVAIYMGAGPAAVKGPVTCTPTASVANMNLPKIQVLVGTNGTEVIKPGESGDNTAEGTFHLNHCTVSDNQGTGNTGAGS